MNITIPIVLIARTIEHQIESLFSQHGPSPFIRFSVCFQVDVVVARIRWHEIFDMLVVLQERVDMKHREAVIQYLRRWVPWVVDLFQNIGSEVYFAQVVKGYHPL